jgi:3',5'-cyclic AMP phosphodiesterase CpdA
MAFRLAHFTDIHFTEHPTRIPLRELLSKRVLGWVNLALLGRYSSFANARRLAEALVNDLEALKPDHVLSTGDLTGLSLPSEFQSARDALAPLLAATNVTGIPGNHDVYVRSAVKGRLYEGSFGAWTRTDLTPGDFPEELRGSYPYPLVQVLGDSLALISLMDVRPTILHDSSGFVPEAQVRLLDALLGNGRLAGRTKVLVLHTGICRADGSRDRRLHGLRNARAIRQAAERLGVALVVHGHIHRRFVIPAGEGQPFAIANPGSLTSRHHAHAYHLLAFDEGRIRLEARRYEERLGAFVPWPDAPGVGLIYPAGRPG